MPTYQQKLENLLQDSVKVARRRFMEDGELPLTEWLIEDEHDTRILIAFTPDVPKEKMCEQMRAMAHDKGIVRYAVQMEAWLAVVPAGSTDDRPPSQRPNRLEAVVVLTGDRQGNTACISIEIERKAGKAFLGEETRNMENLGGNFALFS